MNQTKMVASFLSSIDHKTLILYKKKIFNFKKLFASPLLDKFKFFLINHFIFKLF